MLEAKKVSRTRSAAELLSLLLKTAVTNMYTIQASSFRDEVSLLLLKEKIDEADGKAIIS